MDRCHDCDASIEGDTEIREVETLPVLTSFQAFLAGSLIRGMDQACRLERTC
jgi:hypothetical protein